MAAVAIPSLEVRGGRGDTPPGRVRQQWFDNAGALVASGGRDLGLWWMHWHGLGTFWFGDIGDVFAEPVAASLRPQVEDVFARGVIPVVLLARGCEALHASAIEQGGSVTAFCARSGTGKSTLALAIARSGASHFADDTLLYTSSGSRPMAFKLPFPVRVDEQARRAADTIASEPSIAPPPRAHVRRVYDLTRDDTVRPGIPRFAPVDAPRRFERLLAHAHPFEMAGDERRRAFTENLLALARDVEVWECRFAPSLDALPSLADGIRRHAEL